MHDFKGESKNNQYTFNGVGKELLVVLLKSVEYYPIDINSKKFKTQPKKDIIEEISSTDYTLYISKLIEAINEIKYKRLTAHIKMSDVFQKTKSWFDIGNTFRKKEQEIYQLKTTIHKNAGVNLGKLLDHQLIKNDKTWDIIEFYLKEKAWKNSKLMERSNIPSVLYYYKNNKFLKKQLNVVQKIKTIDAHLENANKLPKYIPPLLQVKFDLEKIQSELIKYSTNLNHIGQLDKNYNRYIIEDIHTAIQIIDKYLSKEVVRKKYPKLQMVIRNDIKDYGNMFIDKTNN
ncbi:DUF6038 family protein [Staphylococcus epidermidis]|nr:MULTISPECIES: DUF6038 family protein [Staphylococcus]MCG7797081.1 DUF6038 family protein [Staphylococcus epidermidis]MCO6293391.1 DUF6038 family protein [Staphylococcus epidermidis]MCO6299117.1 DUF6038 family protein [Staphylococcus epidermidis]MCO6329047.1 DUF6038 family protein [Staphylococcus epidermidis]MCT1536667.1 DUF6038 family protein [Staphylococcus epidermidis]